MTLICGLMMNSACINMSSLQTAETLKPNTSRVIIGGGYYQSPAVLAGLETNEDEEAETLDSEFEELKVPYLEVGARYGLMEDLEVGAKLTLIGTIAADGKYRFYESGAVSLAAGLGLGYVDIESSAGSGETESKAKSRIIDVMLPLYASYRVSEMFALYTSPKYVYRNISTSSTVGEGELKTEESDSSGLSLLGGTLGFMVGSSWGLALETTYMTAIGDEFKMMQVAAGVFF
jgi:hypothetical protein